MTHVVNNIWIYYVGAYQHFLQLSLADTEEKMVDWGINQCKLLKYYLKKQVFCLQLIEEVSIYHKNCIANNISKERACN